MVKNREAMETKIWRVFKKKAMQRTEAPKYWCLQREKRGM